MTHKSLKAVLWTCKLQEVVHFLELRALPIEGARALRGQVLRLTSPAHFERDHHLVIHLQHKTTTRKATKLHENRSSTSISTLFFPLLFTTSDGDATLLHRSTELLDLQGTT